jgi:phospholipid N-methyltransferase
VAPSSTGLAELLAAVTPTAGSPVVVELGPGTGSVSSAIQRRLPDKGRHLVFDEAIVSHTVWWNMPPARIYVCRRPLAVQSFDGLATEARSVRGH